MSHPYLKWVLCGLILVFSALRFVNLDADFPPKINWSGDLFTDEGWYSNAAVNHVITGHWYTPGDFNPAVCLPVGQFLQRLAFALSGLSIFSARLTICLSFTLFVFFIVLLVRKHFGALSALLTALLLVTNYTAFAYSRLAILEFIVVLFVVASIWVATSLLRTGDVTPLLCSSILLAIAILTKTTGFFALPLLAYASWVRGRSLRHRILLPSFVILVVALTVAGYNQFARMSFPEDYSYFVQSTDVAPYGENKNILEILKTALRKVPDTAVLGGPFCILAVISGSIALWTSRRYRQDTLVHLCMGWIFVYFCFLGTKDYGPPRYFLPLIVPIAILSGTALVEIYGQLRGSLWATIPFILVGAVVFSEGDKVIWYMSHPSFSFVTMTHDVADIIRKRERDLSHAVLVGHISNSIALETGVRSINSEPGTQSLEWRLLRYRPAYYVSFDDTIVLTRLRKYFELAELNAWDVYDNYYNGEKVRLLRLDYTNDTVRLLNRWVEKTAGSRQQAEAVSSKLDEPIRILSPAEGDTLRFETARGTIAPQWTGDSTAAYSAAYSVGEGTHHLNGEISVEGTHHLNGEISVNGSAPKYGPFGETMWNTLALYNPWRFRVRRADDPNGWSAWRTFFIAPFSKGSSPPRAAGGTALFFLEHGRGLALFGGIAAAVAGAGLLTRLLLRRRRRQS